MNTYHWSSYWGTWSRVLLGYNSPDGVIELNLTPIDPDWPISWREQIEPIMFRYHGTALSRKDLWGRMEPDPVMLHRMHANIGLELTQRLISTDWLPLLDLNKVKRGRNGGGGISFEECKL